MKFLPIAALAWTFAHALIGAGGNVRAGEPTHLDLGHPSTLPANDVEMLSARLANDASRSVESAGRSRLDLVLNELKVPVSSQVLVFSKTSFQRDLISPATPRALYFNDDTYVGFVNGGEVLEVATQDAALGTAFYTIDQRETEEFRPVRQNASCLQCHASSLSDDPPTLFIRSVHADPTGLPVLAAGTHRTSHRSPLRERWGGWYVTGTHGAARHMGNVTTRDRDDTTPLDLNAGANVTDLTGRFDTAAYLSPHSDIVALMVLEHQVGAHNLIAQANQLARAALRDEAAINRATNAPPSASLESTERRIQSAGEPLVRYLLFSGEAELDGPIEGTSGFSKEFAGRGPSDGRGRSLRDFDMTRRMFRYPCSYMIYSKAFDGLHGAVKQYVYRRLWQVLTGRDTDAEFAHLSEADQAAVYDIILATKPGLPAYWQPRRQHQLTR